MWTYNKYGPLAFIPGYYLSEYSTYKSPNLQNVCIWNHNHIFQGTMNLCKLMSLIGGQSSLMPVMMWCYSLKKHWLNQQVISRIKDACPARDWMRVGAKAEWGFSGAWPKVNQAWGVQSFKSIWWVVWWKKVCRNLKSVMMNGWTDKHPGKVIPIIKAWPSWVLSL